MIPSWYQRPSPPSNASPPAPASRVVLPWVIEVRVGHLAPGDRLPGCDDRHLEQPAREARVAVRREAVEAARRPGPRSGTRACPRDPPPRPRGRSCRAPGGATAGRMPAGSASQTIPPSCSSPESHVPHGVGPPAQFRLVPPRIRYARSTAPSGPKRMAELPPPAAGASRSSRRARWPPPVVLYVAAPSGAKCHGVRRPVHRPAAASYLAAGEARRQHEPGCVGRL